MDDHWADLDSFRDKINELRNEKCIENFDEQLIDYMRLRPAGFEIEQFEPQTVDMNVDLQYESKSKEDTVMTQEMNEFEDASNNTEQLAPELHGIFGSHQDDSPEDPVRSIR